LVLDVYNKSCLGKFVLPRLDSTQQPSCLRETRYRSVRSATDD